MAKKYEYKVTGDLIEFDINKLGKEGWHLAGTTSSSNGRSVLYFDREIESPITHKQEYSHEIER